jgi:RNA polymerase sigma-70 factor (ECF subfamily)
MHAFQRNHGLGDRLQFVAERPRRDADPDGCSLVYRAQLGDGAAFGELYALHERRVRVFLVSALKDGHAAEDAAQAVFERAQRSLSKFDPDRGTPRKWLLGIARNVALKELGRQARLEPWDPAELIAHRDAQRHAPDPHQDAGRWALRELAPLVLDLSPRQREVFVLLWIVGYTYFEAAELMGTSEANVRQLKSQALKKLNGREPAFSSPAGRGRRQRAAMWVVLKRMPVVARRRWALWQTTVPNAR